jgi:hypothetical protein
VGNAKDRPRGLDGLKNRSGKCEGLAAGLDGLKNRNGKWEGPMERGGGRQGKEPEWKMGRTGEGGGALRGI